MLATTLTILLSAFFAAAGPMVDRAPAEATVYKSCVVNNTVALTFDDGPYIWMTQISDTLTKHGAKGTFFVNGDNYDCIYNADVVDRLRYTYNAGHQICSHTWSHPDLKSLGGDEITTEFVKLDTALKKVLGISTAFLRPPFGNYNSLVRQVASEQNKRLVTWDFDSGDSIGESYSQSEVDYKTIIAKHPKTLLALNHETEKNTAQILVENVIKQLQASGYKLVTVAECLGLQPYSSVGSYGTRDVSDCLLF
ncbi:carbohydrate esterase family 4 protein [Mycena crocata]|nr:carbohydrate esterase family 4 protein [Mycena crocata]